MIDEKRCSGDKGGQVARLRGVALPTELRGGDRHGGTRTRDRHVYLFRHSPEHPRSLWKGISAQDDKNLQVGSLAASNALPLSQMACAIPGFEPGILRSNVHLRGIRPARRNGGIRSRQKSVGRHGKDVDLVRHSRRILFKERYRGCATRVEEGLPTCFQASVTTRPRRTMYFHQAFAHSPE